MYDKAHVQFEHPARGPHHCSQCEHFMPTVEECKVVRGTVKPEDWCNQWEPKEQR